MKNIAVITGASSGIGKKFTETLAEHGTFDEVWVIARREGRLEELKSKLPFPVKPVALDLSRRFSKKKSRRFHFSSIAAASANSAPRLTRRSKKI